MKRTLVFYFTLVLIWAIGSVSAAGAKDHMKVVFTPYDFTLDAVVAIDRGYFDMLGLDFEGVNVKGGTATIISTIHRDEIDGCFIASSGALTAIVKDVDIIEVSGIGNRTFDYYVLKDSPIQSLKDFEGKRIGNLPRPSGPWLALKYDMEKNGIRAEVIPFSSNTELASALITKKLDIVSGTPYFKAQFGSDVRLVHSSTISKYLWNSCGWWFKPEYLKEHRTAVKKFVDGLLLARLLIHENPDEAAKILAKHQNLNLSEFKEKIQLPEFDMPVTTARNGLVKTNEILFENGLLEKKIDVMNYVDPSFTLLADEPEKQDRSLFSHPGWPALHTPYSSASAPGKLACPGAEAQQRHNREEVAWAFQAFSNGVQATKALVRSETFNDIFFLIQ